MEEVRDDVPLLRFVPDQDDFRRPDDRRPLAKVFRPSPADVEMAREKNREVMISLTDLTVTPESAAREALASERPQLSFVLQKGHVDEVARAWRRPALKVYRDVPPPGHCGLAGVGPREGSTNEDKAIRVALADRLVAYAPVSGKA
jgi:hypothetical protein